MLVLTQQTTIEYTVKKSRFLTEATPVVDAATAREIWRTKKATYDNGGHIVFAFVIGNSGGIMGCSDDGEPSGTAGRPTLEVVKNSGITNLLVTNARWYGGIQLGTGGLVRAYTECAQRVIAAAATRPLQSMAHVELNLSYPLYEVCRKLLTAARFEVENETFGSGVILNGRLPETEWAAVENAIRDLSKGTACCTVKSVVVE